MVLDEYSGKGFADFKKDLTEILIEKITPISTNMLKLLKDKHEIERILIDGSLKARTIAEKVMCDIKKIIGFI